MLIIFLCFAFRFYQLWTFCSRPTSTSFKKCILFIHFAANRINLLLFRREKTALVGIRSLSILNARRRVSACVICADQVHNAWYRTAASHSRAACGETHRRNCDQATREHRSGSRRSLSTSNHAFPKRRVPVRTHTMIY